MSSSYCPDMIDDTSRNLTAGGLALFIFLIASSQQSPLRHENFLEKVYKISLGGLSLRSGEV